MGKKYTGATKVTFIIEATGKDNAILFKMDWHPHLDTKNPNNNHPAVLEAGARMIDAIGKNELRASK